MTDTPASLDALGIEPFGYHYQKPVTAIIPSWRVIWRTCADPHLRNDGYTETALYSATDLAPLIAKARRVEELEAALRWYARPELYLYSKTAGCSPAEADSGETALAALKENTDATSD